jgi:HEPN domain-containing protein
MSDETDPRAWIARAEEDYETVRLALRRRKPLAHTACFHAQQCAEKYLKALLVAQQHPFPKIHDLQQLSELCEQAGILVAVDQIRLDVLSDFAVRMRYPGEDPSLEETKEAFETAKSVRRFARKWLGVQ